MSKRGASKEHKKNHVIRIFGPVAKVNKKPLGFAVPGVRNDNMFTVLSDGEKSDTDENRVLNDNTIGVESKTNDKIEKKTVQKIEFSSTNNANFSFNKRKYISPNNDDKNIYNSEINEKKKRVLCLKIINGKQCVYGNTCAYAHSIKAQILDPEKNRALKLVKMRENKNLAEINFVKEPELYKQLLRLTRKCAFCFSNSCVGGYNCRQGACNMNIYICNLDLDNGMCKGEEVHCDAIHLTRYGLVPFNKQKGINFDEPSEKIFNETQKIDLSEMIRESQKKHRGGPENKNSGLRFKEINNFDSFPNSDVFTTTFFNNHQNLSHEKKHNKLDSPDSESSENNKNNESKFLTSFIGELIINNEVRKQERLSSSSVTHNNNYTNRKYNQNYSQNNSYNNYNNHNNYKNKNDYNSDRYKYRNYDNSGNKYYSDPSRKFNRYTNETYAQKIGMRESNVSKKKDEDKQIWKFNPPKLEEQPKIEGQWTKKLVIKPGTEFKQSVKDKSNDKNLDENKTKTDDSYKIDDETDADDENDISQLKKKTSNYDVDDDDDLFNLEENVNNNQSSDDD